MSPEALAKGGSKNMFFVYILQSQLDHRYYFGFTEQAVHNRIADHNNGKTSYTSKHRPWKLIWYAGFSSPEKAKAFERYLKSGSGHAFSRKRLI